MPRPHRDDDALRLERVVAASTPVRAARWLAGMFVAAYATSFIANAVKQTMTMFAARPLNDRIRLIGFSLLAFVLVHAALVRMLPPSVAPAISWLFWGLLLAIATLLIVAAGAFASAWKTRYHRG